MDIADIGLAALVLVVVAMMIVPLPTWVLDVLIATNLSASVTILLVVLFVPDTLSVAAFPTVLLLTTLYRLGLNVASSRLILLQANAGEVIRAFGTFVVRGNYVVGGVVFLILTIVQFVVIAKGSERVAEVGARFVLDAMPGKQMAIDAELRTGGIDGNEAKKRRRALARESQFYGAMDGAMKFVKGDVIASLVITVVNILGGLAIGVAQRGLPVTDALKRYGLLTIGDGMVSQIPALVLSIAAGILVTRTASEEPDTPLGAELARQIFGFPKALRAASAFILLLGLVPGLPAAPFLVLAVVLFLVARSQAKSLARDQRRAETEPAERPADARAGDRRGPAFVPVVVPWSIEVSPDLEACLDDAGDAQPGLRTRALGLREVLFLELGAPIPAPRLRVHPSLPPGHAVVSLFEIPTRTVIVAGGSAPAAAADHIAGAALDVLRGRAADFLGLTEAQRLLDALEEIAPAVVRNVVPKPVSLTLLADVLRRLLEERVTIRDLRAVLEALSAVAATEKDPLTLSEFVRGQLRRPITYRLTGGAKELGVLLLDPALEDTIRRAITRTPNGAFLSLPPAASRDVVSAIKRALHQAEAGPRVILTQPDIRRFVRKLLEPELGAMEVVSSNELLPEVALNPVVRAGLS